MKITSFVINIQDGKIVWKSDNQKVMFQRWLGHFKDGQYRLEITKTTSQRTYYQNRALHLWFELLAEEMNNAGYTVQLVLKEKVDLEWDKEKIKELLWRPAQEAILGKKSTTELRKVGDIDEVWEHLNRHIGEKFGIHIPFPNDSPDLNSPQEEKDAFIKILEHYETNKL